MKLLMQKLVLYLKIKKNSTMEKMFKGNTFLFLSLIFLYVFLLQTVFLRTLMKVKQSMIFLRMLL